MKINKERRISHPPPQPPNIYTHKLIEILIEIPFPLDKKQKMKLRLSNALCEKGNVIKWNPIIVIHKYGNGRMK